MAELRFDGRVAVVTGAGNGLGRAHALLLASRGARVVVNDLGGGHTGGGQSATAADKVVAEIQAAGGEAVANYDSVVDGEKIVQTALDTWGKIDIVINNAGILRDVSYQKMSQDDWDLVYQVHVLGAHKVTHAAWPYLRDQGYGRIVNTASAAGIYGNFGQVNYAMAKLGLVGFTNSLAVEGARKGVFANVIAPIAGSRMTETVLPPEVCEALEPDLVSPLVAWLVHDSCDENGALFEVGGGLYTKLRWQRTNGKLYRLGRAVTPEDVKSSWGVITDFETAPTYPSDVMSSMSPILANVNAGRSKGGNKYIDVDEALGFEFPVRTTQHTAQELALYAIGIGAAEDPLDKKELQLVYELHGDGFRPFPTYAVIPALTLVMDMAREGIQPPGQNYGLDRILHGEQFTEVLRPLPERGELSHKARITDIWDKGKHALIVTEVESFDDDGDLLARNRITTLVRGAGGWGGDRGPTEETNVPPERAPDVVTEQKINASQALLYRLSGDWNPLHADPDMAQMFGFERPILHGLCTYGYAARHVVNAFAGGDPRRFKSIDARFAGSVFPGETLITRMWKESDLRVVFECKVKERDLDVVTRAAVEFYAEIPTKSRKPAPAAAEKVEPTNAEPTSADVFAGMKGYFADHAESVQKIGKVFQFRLTNPKSQWTLDCKSATVAAGEPTKPDCTLQLSDADFMDMCTGKSDPMKLFGSGALKISGDLIASQKLDFVQKMDPKYVLDAMQARLGGAPTSVDAPAPAPVAEAAESPATAPAFFDALAKRLADNSALAGEVGAVLQFNVVEPASQWVVDLTGGGVVSQVPEGTRGEAKGTADAAAIFTIEDAHLSALAAADADVYSLFMNGTLRVDGDVNYARKLAFLKGLA